MCGTTLTSSIGLDTKLLEANASFVETSFSSSASLALLASAFFDFFDTFTFCTTGDDGDDGEGGLFSTSFCF